MIAFAPLHCTYSMEVLFFPNHPERFFRSKLGGGKRASSLSSFSRLCCQMGFRAQFLIFGGGGKEKRGDEKRGKEIPPTKKGVTEKAPGR